MMQIQRTKCNCKACPLSGQRKVLSRSDIDAPSIVVIGEAPGEQEDAQGKPFVGLSGTLLQSIAKRAGILWHTVYKMNVVLCRPPKNNIESEEGKKALECCMPGFLEELEIVKKQCKVLIPVGTTSMRACGIAGSISKQRGSVSMIGNVPAVPTFHPSYIMQGNWHEEVTWTNDFIKARELSLKKWTPPKERFHLHPSLTDVKDFVGYAIKTDALVAVDLETTGLNPYWGKIFLIGLAINGEDALVVPFTTKTETGIERYWSVKDELEVMKLMKKLMAECRTLFQNALFDTWFLQRYGMPVKRLTHDTMLIHHVVNPELPHNLGYLVSIYGKTPMWKEVVLGSEEKMVNMDDDVIRTYNARDTVVLHQILTPLLDDMKNMGTERTYQELSLPLVEVLRDMTDYGLLIDREKLSNKSRTLKATVTKTEKKMRDITGVPEMFNFNSGAHLRFLLFGKEPYDRRALNVAKQEYVDNPKRSRITKKYKELEEKIKFLDSVKPLQVARVQVHKTESGLDGVDDEAILQIQRACIKRLDVMECLTRKTEEHKKEAQELQRTLDFIEVYYEYKKAYKLVSTFTGFPVAPDGRIHPSFKIHGTATGRLSSSDPNAQNLPSQVQDVFIAGEHKVLIKADYSNIELRVLAYLADEKILIEAFERGDNIHDLNTKLIFEIDKTHPQWKDIRRAAKVYVFGRSYGGTLEGIYKQILAEVPSIQVTFAHFRQCDAKYFDKLSNYRAWRDKIQKEARETRIVTTAFGRKRILLGTPDEIERQALNTPIQGTAGEICEMALIALHKELKKKPEWDAHIIVTVHDSIIVGGNEQYKIEIAKCIKKCMETKVQLGKYTVSMPVDIGIGKSWAETDTDEAKIHL